MNLWRFRNMSRPPAFDIAQTRRGIRILLLYPGQVQVTVLIHDHGRTGINTGAGSTGHGDILAPAGSFTPAEPDLRTAIAVVIPGNGQ